MIVAPDRAYRLLATDKRLFTGGEDDEIHLDVEMLNSELQFALDSQIGLRK
jgi:hypothetical protein